MRPHILAWIILLLINSLYAQEWYPDSAVVIGITHFGFGTGEASGNRVSVRDSQGYIHAVYCYRIGGPYADSGEVFYVYSTDNGFTWSEPENTSQTDSATSTEPNLVIDSQDRLHCVWKQLYTDTSTIYHDYDLYYSQNDGSGWKPAVNISNQSYGANACYSSMVVDSRDYVHVVWDMDIGFNANWDIFYSFYNDTVWSVPYQVSTSPYDDAFPSLAIDHNDNLYVVWRQWTINGPIYYTRYDGISWTTPEIIATMPGGKSSYPCIVVDLQNFPRVIFGCALPSDSGNIYYTVFDGVAWSSPLNLSNTIRPSAYCSMAIDSLDHLYVVWQEKTTVPDYEVYYRTYNGTMWSDTMNITNDSFFSYCPKLGNPVKGDKVDLVWVSQSNVMEVVYLGLNPVGIVEGGKSHIAPFNLQVFPNPFSKLTNISFGIEQGKSHELKIYDVSGRLVSDLSVPTAYSIVPTTIKWSGTDQLDRPVPPGVYFVRLETDNHTEVKKAILLR